MQSACIFLYIIPWFRPNMDFSIKIWILSLFLKTEEMPQIETRVVLVQEAAKREELLKALEVCGSKIKQSLEWDGMLLDF